MHCTHIHARIDSIASGKELRILPLGDSITYGFQSPDGNGYRLQLQQNLYGNKVNFIGSLHSGNMTNNANEGHSGAVIAEIASLTKPTLYGQPNIVLLHAGTNDLTFNPPPQPWNTAPNRLDALISEILRISPSAVVLVAQIIKIGIPDAQSRHFAFNQAVLNIANTRAAKGQPVMAVDFTSIVPAELVDNVHPNEMNYRRMGDIWYDAIRQVEQKGWIQRPPPPQSVSVAQPARVSMAAQHRKAAMRKWS